MKVVLAAINAKYIHSNLAVYSLKAYAKNYAKAGNWCVEIAEYTINQQQEEILGDLYGKRPDVLCFSCYIWNIKDVEGLVREVKKVLPDTEIWLGGPEVSYDSAEVLQRLGEVTGVMKGEGEETFCELLEWYDGNGKSLEEMKGITCRIDGQIRENPWRPVLDLSRIPFVYQDMSLFQHKIIYYESSRGCPFSCSYCLSSVDKKLRFREIKLVEQELQFFLDQKVPQVKFVDRTFNCSHEHAMHIWKYLEEHDNGVTNFHFEVSADLLNAEELGLLRQMRPGLVQLEIGVQSTNPETVREIRRTMCFEKVEENVRCVQEAGNIHQHLDLIAGLPYEGYERFGRSFDDVYALEPEQLQLGFLKVLKGSLMEEKKEDYGLVYRSAPPYEVLYTKWLSYEEVLRLKGVEEMVEVYYNSRQFCHTMKWMVPFFERPFSLYEALAAFYMEKGYDKVSHSRIARFEILLEFIRETLPDQEEKFRQLLTFDLYLRENAKNRPDFAGEYKTEKEFEREFYDREEAERKILKGYDGFDSRKLRKMTHIETFTRNVLGNLEETEVRILFDYKNRSPLDAQARITVLQK